MPLLKSNSSLIEVIEIIDKTKKENSIISNRYIKQKLYDFKTSSNYRPWDN